MRTDAGCLGAAGTALLVVVIAAIVLVGLVMFTCGMR